MITNNIFNKVLYKTYKSLKRRLVNVSYNLRMAGKCRASLLQVNFSNIFFSTHIAIGFTIFLDTRSAHYMSTVLKDTYFLMLQ